MRISDWSSDVCSSDLFDRVPAVGVASRMDDEKPVGRGDIDARCEKLVAQRAIIFGRTKLGDEPLIKEIRRCIYSLYKRCPRCDAQSLVRFDRQFFNHPQGTVIVEKFGRERCAAELF